ncbi:hypothetical protein ACFWTC_31695 [Streptomyces sp. NPDC058619]|uniref:hypothetical protein n=1 Tax=unclassified Streptomyces TaxID=2593676 RepID=UPI003658A203
MVKKSSRRASWSPGSAAYTGTLRVTGSVEALACAGAVGAGVSERGAARASAAARSVSVRGGGSGAHCDGVLAVEIGYRLGLGFEVHRLLAKVVLAVQVDALAALVGADRDGRPAVVGVPVDDQVAGGDVVVDALGLGADLADLLLVQPGHGVVAVSPLGVDLLLELGIDLHGGAGFAER